MLRTDLNGMERRGELRVPAPVSPQSFTSFLGYAQHPRVVFHQCVAFRLHRSRPPRMTSITALPPELLDRILSLTGVSHHVIDLWKVGNTHLMTSLANGGVTQVVLKDNKFNTTSRFPKMLFQLRSLRRLKIVRHKQALMDASELGYCLQRLSPTLESLELDLKEAEQAFIISKHGSLDIFDKESLEKVGDGQYVKSTDSSLWNIGSVFPKLKKLILRGERHWNNSDFCVLPVGLTNLKLRSDTVNAYTSIIDPSVLPRGLQKLHLGGMTFSSSKGQGVQLPPGLTSLEASYALEDASLGLYSKLPSTLTKIEPHGWNLSPSMAHVIPPNLASMWIKSISCPDLVEDLWTDLLPSSGLTKLDVSSFSLHLRLSKSLLQALPRTLLSLNVFSIDWRSVPIESTDFPPNLAKFGIEYSESMEAADWGLLPKSSLTKIRNFSLEPALPAGSLAFILSSYPKLSFATIIEQGRDDDDSGLELPPIARDLIHMRTLLLLGGYKARIGLKSIRDRLLPPYLTDLTLISNPQWTAECFLGLPSTLRSFSLGDGEDALSASVLANLPANLTSLSVASIKDFNDPQLFGKLPDSLTGLFFNSPIANLPSEALKYLPRRLESLDISSSPPLPPTSIAFLPSGLTYLRVALSDLQDEHMKMLPPSLCSFRYCISDESGIAKPFTPTLTPEIVPFLPQHLQMSSWSNRSCPAYQEFRARALLIQATPIQTPDPRVLKRYSQQVSSSQRQHLEKSSVEE